MRSDGIGSPLISAWRYAGFNVRDADREKIGTVDRIYVLEDGRPEYVRVRTGVFGGRSVLIPWELVRADEAQRVVVVEQPKQLVKDAPAFDDGVGITLEYERELREHFGLAGEDGPTGAGDEGERAESAGRLEGSGGEESVAASPAEAGVLGEGEDRGETDVGPGYPAEQIVVTPAEDPQAQPVVVQATTSPEADAAAGTPPLAREEPVSGEQRADQLRAPTIVAEDAEWFQLGRDRISGPWRPPFDVLETESSYVVLVDVPGLEAEEIGLEFRENVLTVSGNRRPPAEGEVHRLQRPVGEFVRRLAVPPGVDGDAIEAEYRDGVLEIRVPRPVPPKVRRIALGGRRGGGGEARAEEPGSQAQ